MNDYPGYIERIRRANPTHTYLEVALDAPGLEKIRPGMTFLARLLDEDVTVEHWDPYLREQWWPIGSSDHQVLLVERPNNPRYRPGQAVRLLGPVGNAYQFRQSLRTVLLLAYDTDPSPLTIMAYQLIRQNVSVTLVLLGAARTYETPHLPAEVEVVHGDVMLAWPEQVMTLGWADQIFVAVRPDDELNRFAEVKRLVETLRTDIPQHYLFGVFQPYLPCGIGACSACLVRRGRTLLPVCTEGPALDLKAITLPK